MSAEKECPNCEGWGCDPELCEVDGEGYHTPACRVCDGFGTVEVADDDA